MENEEINFVILECRCSVVWCGVDVDVVWCGVDVDVDVDVVWCRIKKK